MKILAISDSHYYNEDLNRILKKYKNSVDCIVHCGDSSLKQDDLLIKQMDIVVKGNHDDEDFPIYEIYNHICVTHGHYYNVYKNYDELLKLCKDNNCFLCIHGHTHVPTFQIYKQIYFINPGSLMMNRGSYGFGTYAIINLDNNQINVDFFHHHTDMHVSNDILTEGLELLDEFKKLV